MIYHLSQKHIDSCHYLTGVRPGWYIEPTEACPPVGPFNTIEYAQFELACINGDKS